MATAESEETEVEYRAAKQSMSSLLDDVFEELDDEDSSESTAEEPPRASKTAAKKLFPKSGATTVLIDAQQVALDRAVSASIEEPKPMIIVGTPEAPAPAPIARSPSFDPVRIDLVNETSGMKPIPILAGTPVAPRRSSTRTAAIVLSLIAVVALFAALVAVFARNG